MCTGLEALIPALITGAGTVAGAVLAPKSSKPPPLPSKPAPSPIQEDPDVKIGQDDASQDKSETYYNSTEIRRKAAQTTGTNLGRSGIAL